MCLKSDHNLQCNAILAFNDTYYEIPLFWHIILVSQTDKATPGVDKAMAKVGKIVKYISKSTQQTAKLLEFLSHSTLPCYSGVDKQLLQDCITRWWPRYQMLNARSCTSQVFEGC